MPVQLTESSFRGALSDESDEADAPLLYDGVLDFAARGEVVAELLPVLKPIGGFSFGRNSVRNEQK
jgi:hypothetical protein